MAKPTGLGGVFLKARDPQTLAAWYATDLGIPTQEGGSLVFSGSGSDGMTVFSHSPLDTGYFGEGPQSFMLNFRVDDLDALLAQLAVAGVSIVPKRESYGYGHFAWIWDPEGNRIELWQPIPDA
jgi:predicted enzyme related to lactoylglutathione lyase